MAKSTRCGECGKPIKGHKKRGQRYHNNPDKSIIVRKKERKAGRNARDYDRN